MSTNEGTSSDANGGPDGGANASADRGSRPSRRRSLLTGGLTVLVALVVVAVFGYFGGIGPLRELSSKRALHPPATLGGLGRITDQHTREQLQLDQAADVLTRQEDGTTAVEAYGDVAGTGGLYVVIALRGRIDVDKTLRDTGVGPEAVTRSGDTTCSTRPNGVVNCYRTSNTLTVMVTEGTGKAEVDRVATITGEAFAAFG